MNIGAFGENFPYSNFHDLNMDWIIKVVKEFEDHYTTLNETIEAGKDAIEALTELKKDELNEKTEELLNDLTESYNHYNELLEELYNTCSDNLENDLETALTQFNTHVQSEIVSSISVLTNKFDELLANIPDDYTALATQVSVMKTAMAGYINSSYGEFDISDFLYLEDKYYDNDSGQYVSLSGYNLYRIPLTESGDFIFIESEGSPFWGELSPSGYAINTYLTSNSFITITNQQGVSWLGGLIQNSALKGYGSAIAFGRTGDTSYIQVCAKVANLATTKFYKNNYYSYQDSALLVTKLNTVSKLTDKMVITQQFYHYTGSYVRYLEEDISSTADIYIFKVKAGDKLTADTLATGYTQYGTYTRNSNDVTYDITTVPYTVPADGIVHWFNNTNQTAYYMPKDSIMIENENIIYNTLQGKKIAFYGDSLTYQYLWCQKVIDSERAIGINLGVGSTTLAGTSNTAMCSSNRLSTVQSANPDIVTILGGANDILNNPVGSESNLVDKDITTFIGAYSHIIDTLLTWKPELKIIIISTTYGLNDGADVSDTRRYGQYADACKMVAEYYHLPYVDIYNESGFNSYTMGDSPNNIYSNDKLHPNENGAKIIASMVIAKLNEIYEQ